MKIKFKILLPLILFCTVFLQQINAHEGSGNWKGTQTGRQTSLYVPSFTTGNNSSSVILDVECSTENVFSEDFGISDINNGNMGRIPSPYMPSGSYEFGDSYLVLPTPGGNTWDDNPIRNAARINDGFYAVVAPEFINDGWFPDDGWSTWWPDNVSDHTGNDIDSSN